MMDVGPVSGKHAHADTLCFEMMFGNERIFVNSGTYGYQHTHRTQLRGTAAHNTLCLEGQNSSEVWGDFNLGRRPKDISYTLTSEPKVGIGVDAKHNGYRHMGATHHRKIFLSEDGGDIRGEDILSGKKGQRFAIHFHLAPGMSYRLISHSEAEITTPKGRIITFRIHGGRLHDALSPYAPQFGQLKPCKQLVIRSTLRHNKAIVKWGLTGEVE